MSDTDPQLEFNFASRRPFVEVPRWKEGRYKGKIDQKALQVLGVFKRSDPHPDYSGLFFKQFIKNQQVWITKEKLDELFTLQREHNKKPHRRQTQMEQKRTRYAQNPTRYLEVSRVWRENNREILRSQGRLAYRRNPDLWKAHSSKRRKKLKTNI